MAIYNPDSEQADAFTASKQRLQEGIDREKANRALADIANEQEETRKRTLQQPDLFDNTQTAQEAGM